MVPIRGRRARLRVRLPNVIAVDVYERSDVVEIAQADQRMRGWEPGGNETRPLVALRVLSCHLEKALYDGNSALEAAFWGARPPAYGTEGLRFES